MSFPSHIKRFICTALLLLTAAVPCILVFGASTDDTARRIIDYKCSVSSAASVQELADGELSHSAGTSPAEWYVISLRRYGEPVDFSAYSAALSRYIDNGHIANPVEAQRIALACSLLGIRSDFVASTAARTGEAGIMSNIYGLILLDSGAYESTLTRNDIILSLLSMQLPDGSWSLSSIYDIDVTAMALQALAPYIAFDDVADAVGRAVSLLSAKQTELGDYKSRGVRNCESTAQVMTALCTLGIDPTADSRFIKNNCSVLDGLLIYKNSDGAFSHLEGGIGDDMATAQTLFALTALKRYRENDSALLAFTDRRIDRITPQTDASSSESASFSTVSSSSVSVSESDAGYLSSSDAASGTLSSSDTQRDDTGPAAHGFPYKPVICAAILLSAGVATVILVLRKKASLKRILPIFAGALLLSAAVLFINIQSVDEYYALHSDDITSGSMTVTVSIRCDAITAAGSYSSVPADGCILDETECLLRENETAFDLLVRATKQHRIPIDYTGSPSNPLSSVYVKSIFNISERQFGDMSGWIFKVNGASPGTSCGSYALSDGDTLEWVYTLDLGKDVDAYAEY